MESELAELAKILEELQKAGSFQVAAEHLTKWARTFTGCQAAVLRLLADDGSPWLGSCALDGPSSRFMRDEVLLHTAECICGRVATGAVDPTLPFYTENGAFVWNTLRDINKHFTPEELGSLRGRCLQEGYESLAVLPVKARGKPIGSLHLADTRPNVFDRRVVVVETVCRLAGNELMKHRSQERNRILLETIGLSLLPAVPPVVPGLEIGLSVVSATDLAKAGGDFYDVYDLGPTGVLLVVGDVSGRGLEALGIATQARYTIQAHIPPGGDPAGLLSRANEILLGILPPRRFVTAGVCLVDRERREVTTCLAGHPAPVVASRGGWTQLKAPTNPPLGLFHEPSFSQSRHPLNSDEVLLLYTDGIVDARQGNDVFGVQGLAETARARVDHHPQDVAETVGRASAEFHDHHLPGDDRLVLAVRLELRDGFTGHRHHYRSGRLRQPR